jgi:hypothetical protein
LKNVRNLMKIQFTILKDDNINLLKFIEIFCKINEWNIKNIFYTSNKNIRAVDLYIDIIEIRGSKEDINKKRSLTNVIYNDIMKWNYVELT